jgi:ankyrin repeat protein
MSKTALLDALKSLDVDRVRAIVAAKPQLKEFKDEKGLNLLQLACKRNTLDDPKAAERQLRLAKWLVNEGFDPTATFMTAPGEDGEEEPAEISLVFFAVARAQNNALARYFMEQGAKPGAFFAAAWWGNGDILADMVRRGADINEVVGATPLHMAVDVLHRGVEGKPKRARRRLECLQEFLRLGADPNIPAFDGTTPLHIVLKKEYDVDVFKLLLKHGANPDVPGKDGRTVREIASRKRDKRYFNALQAM